MADEDWMTPAQLTRASLIQIEGTKLKAEHAELMPLVVAQTTTEEQRTRLQEVNRRITALERELQELRDKNPLLAKNVLAALKRQR